MLEGALTGALRFRLLVIAVAAGLIAVGVSSLPSMHRDVLPELSSGPVLEVQTESPGLSSQEVEQYLTVPIENNLLDGIMGVWDVRSDSIPGLSKVDLYFEPGTTELHARELVEERLTNAFSLPHVAQPPQLIQPLSTSSRALLIGLRSNTVNPLELSYLARWILKPRLSGVPGVANVAIFGQQDRQIQVQVDPQQLARRGVTLQDVINTAGNSQLVSPLSYLEGSTPGTGGFLDGANQRLDVRPVLPPPGDLAAVPIADAPGKVSLGQVANIVEGHQPQIGAGFTQGSAGLVLEIQKLPSASLRGVTKGVERALAEIRPGLQGVDIDTSFFKPATYASDALDNVALGLVIAGALALLALGALLLDLRAACVAASSVALSLVVALLALQWLGQTLNALVVLGLLIAIVVLVDDAVGGAQALRRVCRARGRTSVAHDGAAALTNGAAMGDRHANGDIHGHSDGNGRGRASLTGAPASLPRAIVDAFAQLRGTLGYATLTVLLIAAPLFFSHGLTARYLHPMMLALVLAVLASAVVATTVAPALGFLLLERWPPRTPRAVNPLGSRVSAGYQGLVRRALSLPPEVVLAAALAGAVAFIWFPFLHQPAPPRFKDPNLVVQWTGPDGAGLGEMQRITSRTLGQLRALPVVADTGATLGRAVSGDRIVDPNSGQIYVALKPTVDYDRAVDQVRRTVGGIPGVQASVSTYEASAQAGVLQSGTPSLTVRVYGQDYPRLHALAAQVQRQMSGVNGLGRARVSMPSEQPNIEVAINDDRAQTAGALPGDARRQASTLVNGLTVGNFFEEQAVFDMVVIGAPNLRQNIQDVGNLRIDTSAGGQVKLSDIAQVSVAPDPVDIQHQALSRYVDVTAPVLRTGSVGSARAAIAGALARIHFPLSYHAEVLGGTPEDPTSHALFALYALAAAIGVLLVLQAAFAAWPLAAAFLLTSPVALTGGLGVALATGSAASLGADAGLVAVLMLAIRLGMLQVATVRRLRGPDGDRLSAELIVRAAAERLAPSLETIAVTAVVLIPFVVIGDVAGNEITHTAAAVILGGLLTAAVWSQLFVPGLCLAFAPGPQEPEADPFDDIDLVGLTVPTPELVLKG